MEDIVAKKPKLPYQIASIIHPKRIQNAIKNAGITHGKAMQISLKIDAQIIQRDIYKMVYKFDTEIYPKRVQIH